MKKLTITAIAAVIAIQGFSQYKKASFFNKDGRVYELGVANSFFPNQEGKPAMSFFYSNSIEGDKKISPFIDLEFMPKSKFTYTGTYYSYNAGNIISGKITATRGAALLLKYGLQYRFVNSEAEQQKIVPYVKGALLFGFDFGASDPVSQTDGSVSPEPYPNDTESLVGLEGGAGIAFNFTKNFGIKLGGAFRTAFAIEPSETGTATYHSFKSHPMVAVSLKYKIFSE